MQNFNRLIHAYKQAPWRTQRQRIGVFLLVVLLFSMVAALYLNITASAAIIGRQIQEIETIIAENKRTNANLESEIAAHLAKENVEERALSLGYETVAPENIEYLVVPGYKEPEPFQLAMAPAPKHHAPTVPPEYTQSLLDWLDQNLFTPAVASSGGTR
jgi:cell division protein FtsL